MYQVQHLNMITLNKTTIKRLSKELNIPENTIRKVYKDWYYIVNLHFKNLKFSDIDENKHIDVVLPGLGKFIYLQNKKKYEKIKNKELNSTK